LTSSPSPQISHTRNWIYLLLAIAATLPWVFLSFAAPRDAAGHWELSHIIVATLSGIAILAAAFLLSWGAEVAQLDMAQSLALVILSLIAILPEYSVDMAFAWAAGKGWALRQDPATANLQSTRDLWENVHYAVANMTGANRILVGVAWSTVVFL
jgi:cation:H+ antiporter